MTKKVKRVFTGVWIPAKIWLSQLTIHEKLLLAEIESLGGLNQRGCYASNSHFADFFKVSKPRITQVLKSLKNKKLIHVTLKYKNKQIEERIIHIQEMVVNELVRGDKNIRVGGSKNIRVGYPNLCNEEDNRRKKEEEKKNIKKEKNFVVYSDFDKIWKLYPRKKGTSKAKALAAWVKVCKLPKKSNAVSRPTFKHLKKALMSQSKSERWTKQEQYIPHAATWLNGYRWLDDADSLTSVDGYSNDNVPSNTYSSGDYKVKKEVVKM